MSLRKAFGFSAIEAIGSRVFDLVTLWLVLNNLPEQDIAKFGVATSSIFFFNFVFLVPETALTRFQKVWAEEGSLGSYLSSFVAFSAIKIALHAILALGALLAYGSSHWLFYAVLFSAITQQIQMAEIVRIYMRMRLEQARVARFELISKTVLTVLCLSLFALPLLDWYFTLYFCWSLVIASLWMRRLKVDGVLRWVRPGEVAANIVRSMRGYSLWAQVSGNLSFYIYNSSVFFLAQFSTPVSDLATYTVVVRVTNLFFVVPMLFQSFVPVVLSNSTESGRSFHLLLRANIFVSVAQFVLFVLFGAHIGAFFGLADSEAQETFYEVGLIVSVGVLFLNMSRPISLLLLIESSPRRVMALAFIPTAAIATVLYPLGIWQAGLWGSALSSSVTYTTLALIFFLLHRRHRRGGSPTNKEALK